MTSIEWFFDKLKNHEIQSEYFELYEQAKEMHNQEVIDAYNNGALIYNDNKAKEMIDKDMCKFAEFVAIYSNKNRNVNGEMLHAKSKYDESERTIDLLEIFRKINNK